MSAEHDTSKWLAALDCDHETQVMRMQASYADLAGLPDEALQERLDAIIHTEYGLNDTALGALTAARLEAWLRLASVNVDGARRLGKAYDAVFARLPGAMEFRRAVAAQTFATRGLSADQRSILSDIIPGFSRFMPSTHRRPLS